MKRMGFLAVAGILSIACQRPAERTAQQTAPSPSATPATAATPAPGGALPAEAPAGAPLAANEPAAPAAVPKSAPHKAEPTPVAAAPTAPPAPEPTPTPTPAPTPRPRIVPSGTKLAVVLEQAVTTKSAKAEDPVVATLAEDVTVDDEVLLPKGAEVHGHVVSAVRSGRVKGRAHLVVAFSEVRVNSRSYAIDATGFDITAGSSTGKDAKISGGSAAAGGGSGALKGGLIGGAVGGGAVLATHGVEVELKQGSAHTLTLKKSLRVR